MKDRQDDIEKIFRDGFENFEAEVDPSVWSSISSGINNAGTGGASSQVTSPALTGAAPAAGIVKIAAIVAATGLIATGGYYIFSGDAGEKSRIPAEVVESEVLSEAASVEIIGESPVPPAIKTDKKTENGKAAVSADPGQPAPGITGSDLSGMEAGADDGEAGQEANTSGSNTGDKTKITRPEADHAKAENETKYASFEASIHASVRSGKQPLEVFFENRGTYSPDLKWKFGDGSQAFETSVSHTFEKSGSYWVSLEIKGENGIKSRDSVCIIVEGKAYVSVPNVFSPNGDGLSDAFFIESEYIGTFSCQIFDRNGRPVFEWNNTNGHWDGRDMSGALMPPGIYFYVVKATDLDGNPLSVKKGTVTLFR